MLNSDYEKFYNKISWSHYNRTSFFMGFKQEWINWAMSCLNCKIFYPH